MSHGRFKYSVAIDVGGKEVVIPAGTYVLFLKERPSDKVRQWNRALIYPAPTHRKYPASGPALYVYPDDTSGYTVRHRPVRGTRTLDRAGNSGVSIKTA